MDTNANAMVTTCANLECRWAEQHCPNFVPPHPEQQGGIACFDSGVGMVSCATITHYPHLANSIIGAYPSTTKVSYHRLPQLSGS